MTSYSKPRPTVACDTECFYGVWAIAFTCVETGRTKVFEQLDDQPLDRAGVASFLRKYRIITFNGLGYDLPMISLALKGASCLELKQASDHIIQGGLRSWQFYDTYNCPLPDYIDNVDLMEVSPGSPTKPSLKLYSGRMHSRRMQELPFEHDRRLTADEIDVLRGYHGNDMQVTVDFYNELKPQLELRCFMSDQYGIDLRSKSDAQIAEAVIKTEIERMTGERVYKPEIRTGSFRYKPPAFLRFESERMREVFEIVKAAKFTVGSDGVVRMPEEIAGLEVCIGSSTYVMGIGGLHSTEKSVAHKSDDEYVLKDRDVASYYPNIILQTGLAPRHLGKPFLNVYRPIVESRLADKLAGRVNEAETKKIVVNGGFGKLGSPYSILYAPNLMIQVTVTGQLSLLMLIDRMEAHGFSVVSANTDGFVTKVDRARDELFESLVWDWELETGFETEETIYSALYSRDINNYVAFTPNGKVKLKGAYTPAGRGLKGASGLKKNPNLEISIEAAVTWLRDGTPVEDTIEDCRDVRKFVTVRTVKGGALHNGQYVGKAIRWYYAKGEDGCLSYKTNGNTVPRSQGAKPLMLLPDELPGDVDYSFYIREAYAILQDVGAQVVDPALRGRTGTILARLPDQKNLHYLDLKTGVALCGKARESIRDAWVEYRALPEGHKLCGKCNKLEI